MTPPWLVRAWNEIGVSEVEGPGDNPRIIEYAKETSLKATHDSIPWCAAFACAMLEWSGVPSPRSARAKDFLSWGRGIEKPVEGCLVVLDRPPHPESGHVGFYVSESLTSIFLVGGNQDDRVCEKEYSKQRVLGYRMPPLEYWDEPVSGIDPSHN